MARAAELAEAVGVVINSAGITAAGPVVGRDA